MHSLTTAYTVYFNRRHRRHGHLVDGRFKAKLVDGDEYLLALTRYVHQNPVCVGAVKKRPIKERIERLRKYKWSTYRTEPLDPDHVLAVVAEAFGVGVDDFMERRRNSFLRAVAARFFCRYSVLTQREVASRLGVGTGAAVSRQMKKLSEHLPSDRRLQNRIKKAERILDEERSSQCHHFIKY